MSGTWTTPVHVVAAADIVAADFNAQVIDDLLYLYSGISARVYHNTTQSLTLATANKVLFNSERTDNTAMHSTVSNTSRLTAIVEGFYTFIFNGEWATAPATADVYMLLNNTDIIAFKSEAGGKRFTLSTAYLLAANDYVEVVINPVSTQTLNSTAKYSPEFIAIWHGTGA